MSLRFYILAVLLISLFQGGVTAKYVGVENFKSWFSSRVEALVHDLSSAEVGLEAHYKNVIEAEKSRITNALSRAEGDVNALKTVTGAECADAAHQSLLQLKSSSLSDFIHCAEAGDIVFNIKEVGTSVISLITRYLDDIKAGLNGLDDCKPFLSEYSLKCINAYIWELVDLLKDLIIETEHTVFEIKNLTATISREIADCSKTPSVHKKVQIVLSELQDCSNKK